MRVLFVASECAPFAREGALGDVVGALPAALRAQGVDARVVIPRYGWISPVATDGMSKHLAPLAVPLGDAEAWCAVYEATVPGSDVPVYMLDHEVLFDRPYLYDPPGGTAHDNLARFAFLSRGAMQLAKHLGWVPDVMHAHDWPTALVPVYLATLEGGAMFRRTASVLSVYDVRAQGRFSREEFRVTQLGDALLHPDVMEDYGLANVLKGGLVHANRIVTRTLDEAEALRDEVGGGGLEGVVRARGEHLVGVLSGHENPSQWSLLAERLVGVYRAAMRDRRGAER